MYSTAIATTKNLILNCRPVARMRFESEYLSEFKSNSTQLKVMKQIGPTDEKPTEAGNPMRLSLKSLSVSAMSNARLCNWFSTNEAGRQAL
jgi:hypothetical protein